MSQGIIEVPITRRDKAVADIMWTDPVRGKQGLLGKDFTDKEDPKNNYVEVYDADGKVLFRWTGTDGPMDNDSFKTAHFIAKESFRMRGVN